MRYVKNIAIVFLLASGLVSCRKYVEIEPKGKIVPTEVRDFRQLMNNTQVLSSTIGLNELATDDISYSSSPIFKSYINEIQSRVYNWDKMVYTQETDDEEWNTLYKQIYIANVVINGIPASVNGTQIEKDQVMGEALLLRATNYLYLINSYAAVYNPSTATKDLGVPLILEPDLKANLVRVPIQQVYDQIIADLEKAIALPLFQSNTTQKYFGCKAAVYATLARTYLYMGNFQKAAANATLALAINNTVLDYNTYANSPELFPKNNDNSEIIYWKDAANDWGIFYMSDDLLNLLSEDDLRKKILTIDGDYIWGVPGISYNGESYYNPITDKWNSMVRNTGPTVPEMMLIQSENLARSGKTQEALDILNTLRVKRFPKASYKPLTGIPSAEILKVVLDERRRELFMKGLRWFDLRRLDKEPAFAKTLVHTWSDGAKFELQPGSLKYVFPIPLKVVALSPEIIQNPR